MSALNFAPAVGDGEELESASALIPGSVGLILHRGSWWFCFDGMEQDAVTIDVVLLTLTIGLTLVTVNRVCVVVTVSRLGVTVVIRWIVVEATVTVEVGPVEVDVSVSTTVEFTTCYAAQTASLLRRVELNIPEYTGRVL